MHRGFRKGMGQIPSAKVADCRSRLIAIIGGETRSKYLAYMSGKTIIYPDVSRRIERVFAAYGIQKCSIFDE